MILNESSENLHDILDGNGSLYHCSPSNISSVPFFLCAQIGEEAEESLKQEQDKLTEGLDELLKSGASEVEIFSTIEEFKEKFADYGRDRRSTIEFHLRNVERLLMPTRTTSVALRALHGVSGPSSSAGNNAPPAAAAAAAPVISPTASADSAAPVDSSVLAVDTPNPALQPKAMFQYLVNYLQVTPEQAGELKDSRWVAQELDESLVQALHTLEELRTRLTQCGKDLEAEFNTVRSILTPTQAAKFLVWVANNSACMHMLMNCGAVSIHSHRILLLVVMMMWGKRMLLLMVKRRKQEKLYRKRNENHERGTFIVLL